MLQPTVRVVRKRNLTDSQQEYITEMTQVSLKERVSNAKKTYESDLIEFRGLNQREAIIDNEFSAMQNLSSSMLPYITTRAPRSLYESLTSSANGIFSNGLELAVVDGTQFKYDGVVKGTVTNTAKTMVNMNGNIVIFPDKAYYDYVNGTWGTFTSPDLDYVCEWDNRLWGVKSGDPYVYASVQGDFKDWTTKNGDAMDSYFVDSGGNSEFRGIQSYHGHVTVFKHDQYYEIYGSEPSNFQLIQGAQEGLINNRGLVELKSVLYFFSDTGIMAYTGGYAEEISYPLNLGTMESAAFGMDHKQLYVCLYDGLSYTMYIFDPLHQVWFKEDNLNVVQFCYHQGYMYGLTNDGKVYEFDSGSESISWNFETKQFDDVTFQKKEYHQVNVKLRLYAGASVNVFLKVDEGDYSLIENLTFEDSKIKDIVIPVNVIKCNRFQIKMDGIGKFVMYHVQRQYSIGSELPTEGR